MTVIIIACIGGDGGLGKDGKLLWNIPADKQKFGKFTTGHTVIMGRKTFESIGKRLRNRRNIILSRTLPSPYMGCHVQRSLDDALELCRNLYEDTVFIIGGENVYREAFKVADEIYLSVVSGDAREADVYFPLELVTKNDWCSVKMEGHAATGNTPRWTWWHYKRRRGPWNG